MAAIKSGLLIRAGLWHGAKRTGDVENLFCQSDQSRGPLPARMRPENWAAFIGQTQLVDRLRGRSLHSMILYGPPGCGKTTLARILAHDSGVSFQVLSAASAGVKEVRAAIEEGRTEFYNQGQGIVLFLDEIHRFSKSQQDALLEAVETGWIVLIGATTENPGFAVNSPLLSRCRVYRLEALTAVHLDMILTRALKNDPRLRDISLTQAARETFIEGAGGDARCLLASLETALLQNRDSDTIDRPAALLILEGQVRKYDRQGENHYDYTSAFIKSLRGSDPDAALLYLACMIESGEDPLYLARRLIIFAAEDIGNASPQALNIAVAAHQALERIGMPEGRIVLGQAVTFLASSPKSNAAYLGINAALKAVHGKSIKIPGHLRNAPTKFHAAEGAGQNYKYPHDHPGHFIEENYFPEDWPDTVFYEPTRNGQEDRIYTKLRQLWPKRYPV